ALAFGPPVKTAEIHFDLAFGRQFDVRAIHGSRRWPLEVDAFGIVAGAMTRAFELVFAGLPVGSAPEVRADRRDDENSLRVSHHPDTVLVLEFGIHTETKIRRVTDQEFRFRLVERPGKEESQEHQKVDAEE